MALKFGRKMAVSQKQLTLEQNVTAVTPLKIGF